MTCRDNGQGRLKLLLLLSLACSICVFAAFLPYLPCTAEAATFNVNNTADVVDANPGNGVCATAGAVCTLRAAIQEANALAGADTINIPAGTYTLAIAGTGENASATGDLDITDALTITGSGQGTTIINGGAIDRVFDMFAGAVTVNISDLTVTNGKPGALAGGIYNSSAVTLTLTRVSVTSNVSTGQGGGINNPGTLILNDVDVTNNTAGSGGGGIFNNGTITYTSGTVSGNSASSGGGGIASYVTATMTNVTISGNSSTTDGGGIYGSGTVTLNNSTVSGNTANTSGGGIFDNNTVNLNNVTVSNNTSPSGGGILLAGGKTLNLTNVTIYGNITGMGVQKGSGGGPTTSFKNTIIAGNAAGNCSQAFTSGGYNLESTTNTCGFTGGGDQNSVTAGNLNIGALASNGGPTQTHALLAGSFAIDRIPNGTNGCGTTITTDQRGIARPQNGTCDVGAYELVPASPITTIGNGIAPANKTVLPNDINKAANAFTLYTSTGTDTLTAMAVTFSGTTAGNVAASGVKIWRDNGSTSNEWDSGDTLIGTASFSGTTASFSGLSVGITTTPAQYLVTYNLIAAPGAGNTLRGAVTAATLSNALINLDAVDATLTVASYCNVTTTTDGVAGSLRNCITWANGYAGTDTIMVPAGTYTLTVTGAAENANANGDLDITESINITGAGMTTTIIDGNAGVLNDRILHTISTAANVTLTDLTLQNANAGANQGAGIYHQGTTLTLTRVVVKNNTTTGAGGAISTTSANTINLNDVELSGNSSSPSNGGGIYTTGATVTWNGGTASNNSAGNDGGAVRNGGTFDATNVTFSGNSSTVSGAAIQSGTTTLTNCTIYGNTGTATEAFRQNAGSATIKNTIISNSALAKNCNTALTSSGGNLETVRNDCGFTTGTDQNSVSLVNLNINAILADNGGYTKTHALNSGSFAIDAAVSANCPATDQRGQSRGYDGNGIPNNPQPGDCDIGAFEKTTPAGFSISGKVFEDANFAGTAAEYEDETNDKALSNVDVEIYTNAGAYIASANTDASGNFGFTGLANGTYKVRVRAATIGDADTPPKGGLNGTVPGTWPYPIPEMTWGNGVAMYGGQSATVDDSAAGDNAGPGDNWVSVTVSGGNVSSVNFGFAYNLIVNVDDDSNADNARSKQGSLRQFIKNANAIGTAGGTTANSSEFRMQVATNQTDGGGNNWWRVTMAASPPSFGDGGTTLNGARQRLNSGTDSNTLGPEIEIYGNGLAAGLLVNGVANVTLQELTVNGFSGASGYGIRFTGGGATGGKLHGSYVGTNATGTAPIANVTGVSIIISASGNSIGGSNAGEGNVISGNTSSGVSISSANNNTIRGNYIGTNAAGTAPVANTSYGITVNASSGTMIGGANPGEGNVISGNGDKGMQLTAASSMTIQGNIIGLSAAGNAKVANGNAGIGMDGANPNNITIGGTTAGAANIISGNSSGCISISSTANNIYIYGNKIGTGPLGTETTLGNSGFCIDIGSNHATPNIKVGGLAEGQGNLIAHNSSVGVNISTNGTGIEINGNTIRSNGVRGIALNADGVRVAKNLIRNNGFDGILLWAGGTNAKIYHNTLHSNSGDGIEVQAAGTVIRNNIITGHSAWGINRVAASMTESNNLITDNSVNPASVRNASGRSNVALDASTINYDPKYVNAAANNYGLTECSSMAINRGLDLGGDQPDVNGASPGLFNSSAPDMGAFETSCTGVGSDIIIDGNFSEWGDGQGNDLCVNDQGGADDWTSPSKLDITKFCVASNRVDTFFVLFGFDDVTLSNDSTACVLIDTSEPLNDKPDYVLCVTIDGPGATRVSTVGLYSCDDTIIGGCNNATLVKTYTSANYGFSNTVTGPFGNNDSFVEVAMPYTDLGISGTKVILSSLISYPGVAYLKSPKDSIFGGAGGQNYNERFQYDMGSGSGGIIGAPGTTSIFGNVFSDEGITPIGSGRVVRLVINGVDRGSNTTDANGGYFISAAMNAGDAVLVYIDNHATNRGTTVTMASGGHLSGIDIYAGHVITRHDNGGSLTNANMTSAKGGYVDADIDFSVSGGNLTVSGSGTELYVASGHTFAPAGNVATTHMKITGTADAGGNTFTLSGDWANLGTFNRGSSSVVLNGANQAISGNTTFHHLTKSVAAAATLTVQAGSSQAVAGTATINGASGQLLSLRSSTPGTRWNFTMSAGSTKSMSFLDVQDSDASGSDAALKPINPANSDNSGNTIDWFGVLISGTVYSDEGVTNVGAGKTVRLLVNGTSVGTSSTNASGVYGIVASPVAGDRLLVYVDQNDADAATDGTTVTVSSGSALNNLHIYYSHLITRHDNAGALTNALMKTAVEPYSDTEILYSVDGSNVLTVSGATTKLYVPTGYTFAPGGNFTTTDVKVLGTLNGGTYTYTVAGNWDSSGGTVAYGSSTLNMIGVGKTFQTKAAERPWNLTIGDGVSPASVTHSPPNWLNAVNNDLVLSNNATLNVSGMYYYMPKTGGITLGAGATLNISGGVMTRYIDDSSSHISTAGTISGTGTFEFDIQAGSVNAPVTARTYGVDLSISGAVNAVGILGGGASLNLGAKNLHLYDVNTNNDFYGILDNPGNIPVTAAELYVANPSGSGNAPWFTGKLICRAATYTFSNVTVYSSNTAVPSIDCATGGASSTWNVSGNVTIDGSRTYKGLITAGASTWNVGGNWSNSGTFTAGTSTVNLNGTDQSITGNTTFSNLTKSVATARTLIFAAGSTTTVNGTATLNGASGQLLMLRSSIPSTRWNFTMSAGSTKSMSFLDVQDSDASGSDAALKPINPADSVNSGNTIDWFSQVSVDSLIKLAAEGAGAYLTDNLYEATATVQVKSQGVLSGTTASFTVQFQNDGGAIDSIIVTGTGNGPGFTVQYLDETATDRTAAVTGAGYTIAGLAGGANRVWTVNVTPSGNPTPVPGGTAYDIFVTATSVNDGARTDQVKATTTSTSANLTLLKNADKANVNPGEEIAYTVTATNSAGLTAASGIALTDPIPANTGFKMGSSSFNPGTSTLTSAVSYSNDNGSTWVYAPASGGCAAPAGYDYCVTHVRWTMTGNMPSGSTFGIGMVVRVK